MFVSSVCESFMLGTIATFYTTDAVLMAVGTTAAVTLALTLFAFQTKIDFTGCGGEGGGQGGLMTFSIFPFSMYEFEYPDT